MRYILGIITILCLTFLIIGIVVPSKFEYEKVDQFEITKDSLWTLAGIPENWKYWNDDIDAIQKIEQQSEGRNIYKIHFENGEIITVLIIFSKSPSYLEYKILQNSNGLTGVWKLTFSGYDSNSALRIKEDSEVKDLVSRAFHVLKNRKNNLEKQFQKIHNYLSEFN